MGEPEEIIVETNGIKFKALQQGDGETLAVLLHGFPDDARTWLPIMDVLSDNNFTTVAPYMRGYGDTDPAPEGQYRVSQLAKDALGIEEAVAEDHKQSILIGHDWGASATYAAVTINPDQFTHAVALSMIPRFWERMTPTQVFRSWYIAFFQLPGVAERAIAADDFALVEHLWRTWSPSWDYPDDHLEEVKETFRKPGTVEAALAYYRDLIPSVSQRYNPETGQFKRYNPIDVPTLILFGTDDSAIGVELSEDIGDAFSAPHRVERLADIGHFVPREAPDRVSSAILEFIDDY